MYSLIFLKAKHGEKFKKVLNFDLVQIKNRFAHFQKIKKIFKKISSNFIFVDFWNRVPKNISDQQKCGGFQKSKKGLNHSTLVTSTGEHIKSSQYLFKNIVFFFII